MSPAMQLVMASESPYRRDLMDRLGIPYLAVAHQCDERALEPRGQSPEDIAITLARAKALSLAERYPQAFILGSDQVLAVDGDILGKPGSRDEALGQLLRLRGREHRLCTAVALRAPDGRVDQTVDVHVMRMRALSDHECERYIAAEAPLDCCGSYKIERMGIALFEEIRGSDFTAIIGLPMISVVTMLRRAGFQVP